MVSETCGGDTGNEEQRTNYKCSMQFGKGREEKFRMLTPWQGRVRDPSRSSAKVNQVKEVLPSIQP
jgi:hypothetical protein